MLALRLSRNKFDAHSTFCCCYSSFQHARTENEPLVLSVCHSVDLVDVKRSDIWRRLVTRFRATSTGARLTVFCICAWHASVESVLFSHIVRANGMCIIATQIHIRAHKNTHSHSHTCKYINTERAREATQIHTHKHTQFCTFPLFT